MGVEYYQTHRTVVSSRDYCRRRRRRRHSASTRKIPCTIAKNTNRLKTKILYKVWHGNVYPSDIIFSTIKR